MIKYTIACYNNFSRFVSNNNKPWGLSLGETEAINNLFSDYYITENIIDYDFEFASILEIEFIKDKSIEFFDFISIEKWSILIEIIKNIKKRRGRKGLKT